MEGKKTYFWACKWATAMNPMKWHSAAIWPMQSSAASLLSCIRNSSKFKQSSAGSSKRTMKMRKTVWWAQYGPPQTDGFWFTLKLLLNRNDYGHGTKYDYDSGQLRVISSLSISERPKKRTRRTTSLLQHYVVSQFCKNWLNDNRFMY